MKYCQPGLSSKVVLELSTVWVFSATLMTCAHLTHRWKGFQPNHLSLKTKLSRCQNLKSIFLPAGDNVITCKLANLFQSDYEDTTASEEEVLSSSQFTPLVSESSAAQCGVSTSVPCSNYCKRASTTAITQKKTMQVLKLLLPL